MSNAPHLAWNDPAIIAAIGPNIMAIRDALKGMGQPVPSEWAVYQWTSRRRIPDRWRPAVVYWLLSQQKITVADLFRRSSAARGTQVHVTVSA